MSVCSRLHMQSVCKWYWRALVCHVCHIADLIITPLACMCGDDAQNIPESARLCIREWMRWERPWPQRVRLCTAYELMLWASVPAPQAARAFILNAYVPCLLIHAYKVLGLCDLVKLMVTYWVRVYGKWSICSVSERPLSTLLFSAWVWNVNNDNWMWFTEITINELIWE